MKINSVNNVNFGRIIRLRSDIDKEVKILMKNPINSAFHLKDEPGITYIFTGREAKIFSNSCKEALKEMDFWSKYYDGDSELASDMADVSLEKHYDRMAEYIKKEKERGYVLDLAIIKRSNDENK